MLLGIWKLMLSKIGWRCMYDTLMLDLERENNKKFLLHKYTIILEQHQMTIVLECSGKSRGKYQADRSCDIAKSEV